MWSTMPIPRQGTAVTSQVVGNLDLCDVLCGGHMGDHICSLPCGVQKNVSPEAIFCVSAIKGVRCRPLTCRMVEAPFRKAGCPL